MQLGSGTFSEKPALGLETTDVTDEATAATKRLQPLSLSKPHIHALVQIIKHIVTRAGFLGVSSFIHPCYCCCLVASVKSDSSLTPWTVARQAPLFMGFPRHEYWGGLSFPSPGDLPDTGIEPRLLHWQVGSLPLSHSGKLFPCRHLDYNLVGDPKPKPLNSAAPES